MSDQIQFKYKDGDRVKIKSIDQIKKEFDFEELGDNLIRIYINDDNSAFYGNRELDQIENKVLVLRLNDKTMAACDEIKSTVYDSHGDLDFFISESLIEGKVIDDEDDINFSL